MRRKDEVGRISLDDAKAVLESFLQSLHVQSLGQHDRRVRDAFRCITYFSWAILLSVALTFYLELQNFLAALF